MVSGIQSPAYVEQWVQDIVGSWTLRYYLTQPALTQWVAVGLVLTARGYVFLTARGRNESEALSELRQRVLNRLSSDAALGREIDVVGCAA